LGQLLIISALHIIVTNEKMKKQKNKKTILQFFE